MSNIGSYKLVAVDVLVADKHVLAIAGVSSDAIYASAAWGTNNVGVTRILGAYFTRSGTSLKLISTACNDVYGEENLNTRVGINYAVTAIWGLVKA